MMQILNALKTAALRYNDDSELKYSAMRLSSMAMSFIEVYRFLIE